MEASHVVVLAVVGVAAVIDVRTQRIPNMLTFGSAAAALLFHSATNGASGLMTSAAGWGVGVAIFLPFFLLRGMGAGDVKLLGAVGAWLGPAGALGSGFFSIMAGGVLALAVALRRRYLKQAFTNLWGMFLAWRTSGLRKLPGVTIEDSRGPRLAYATAIAVGTLAAMWWQ